MTVERPNAVPEGAIGRQTTINICYSCTDRTQGTWLETPNGARRVLYYTQQDTEDDHQFAQDSALVHDNDIHGGRGQIVALRFLHAQNNPAGTKYAVSTAEMLDIAKEALETSRG
jgi:hypothetical protein